MYPITVPATHKGRGPEANNLNQPIVHLLWTNPLRTNPLRTNPLQNENQKEGCFQYDSLGLIQSRKYVTA